MLSRVMDQDHRKIELPLQAPDVGEELRYLTRVVLVQGVEPYQGIEEEEPWSKPPGGLEESLTVADAIESQGGHGDGMDVESPEIVEAAVAKETHDP
jgi:hypothetical protein